MIRQKHDDLGCVVGVMQQLVRDIAAGHGAPHFAPLSLALCYIDDFRGDSTIRRRSCKGMPRWCGTT